MLDAAERLRAEDRLAMLTLTSHAMAGGPAARKLAQRLAAEAGGHPPAGAMEKLLARARAQAAERSPQS